MDIVCKWNGRFYGVSTEAPSQNIETSIETSVAYLIKDHMDLDGQLLNDGMEWIYVKAIHKVSA